MAGSNPARRATRPQHRRRAGSRERQRRAGPYPVRMRSEVPMAVLLGQYAEQLGSVLGLQCCCAMMMPLARSMSVRVSMAHLMLSASVALVSYRYAFAMATAAYPRHGRQRHGRQRHGRQRHGASAPWPAGWSWPGLARTGLRPFTVAATGFGVAILTAALVPSLPGELAALAVVGFLQYGAQGNRQHDAAAHRGSSVPGPGDGLVVGDLHRQHSDWRTGRRGGRRRSWPPGTALASVRPPAWRPPLSAGLRSAACVPPTDMPGGPANAEQPAYPQAYETRG